LNSSTNYSVRSCKQGFTLTFSLQWPALARESSNFTRRCPSSLRLREFKYGPLVGCCPLSRNSSYISKSMECSPVMHCHQALAWGQSNSASAQDRAPAPLGPRPRAGVAVVARRTRAAVPTVARLPTTPGAHGRRGHRRGAQDALRGACPPHNAAPAAPRGARWALDAATLRRVPRHTAC
jgi:hypothetical protein